MRCHECEEEIPLDCLSIDPESAGVVVSVLAHCPMCDRRFVATVGEYSFQELETDEALRNRLAPCPHCGGAADIAATDKKGTSFMVGCTNEMCLSYVDFGGSKEETIKAWNRRERHDT